MQQNLLFTTATYTYSVLQLFNILSFLLVKDTSFSSLRFLPRFGPEQISPHDMWHTYYWCCISDASYDLYNNVNSPEIKVHFWTQLSSGKEFPARPITPTQKRSRLREGGSDKLWLGLLAYFYWWPKTLKICVFWSWTGWCSARVIYISYIV